MLQVDYLEQLQHQSLCSSLDVVSPSVHFGPGDPCLTLGSGFTGEMPLSALFKRPLSVVSMLSLCPNVC